MAGLNGLAKKHPLQRFSAPSRTLSALLHIAGLACNAYSFHYLATHENRITRAYGWHLQYFTVVGLVMTAITFTTALLADITLSTKVFKLKNFLSVASAPIEMQISLTYWAVRTYDPELVVAPDVPALPLPSDITFHLAPLLFLTADLLFFSPPYTIAALPSYALSSLTAVVYYFWLERCHARNGFYPYPLLDEIPPFARIGVFVVSAIFMGSATGLLRYIYEKVNGREMDQVQKPRPGGAKKRN